MSSAVADERTATAARTILAAQLGVRARGSPARASPASAPPQIICRTRREVWPSAAVSSTSSPSSSAAIRSRRPAGLAECVVGWCADDEAGRHRQPSTGQLAEIRSFAASELDVSLAEFSEPSDGGHRRWVRGCGAHGNPPVRAHAIGCEPTHRLTVNPEALGAHRESPSQPYARKPRRSRVRAAVMGVTAEIEWGRVRMCCIPVRRSVGAT